MKTIIEKVIGWDLKNKRPNMNKPGLFGIPEAFTHTTEEQGRRSLHGHFLIWIKGNDKINENLYSTNKIERNSAMEYVCKEVDRTSSCELMSRISKNNTRK